MRYFNRFFIYKFLNSPNYYHVDNIIPIIRENNFSFWQTKLSFYIKVTFKLRSRFQVVFINVCKVLKRVAKYETFAK